MLLYIYSHHSVNLKFISSKYWLAVIVFGESQCIIFKQEFLVFTQNKKASKILKHLITIYFLRMLNQTFIIEPKMLSPQEELEAK